MRRRDIRALGQFVFAILAWSSCLPVVLACDSCDDDGDDGGGGDNGPVRRAMIGVIVVCVLLLTVFCVWLVWRRLRARRIHAPDIPHDGTKHRSSDPSKSFRAPSRGGYHQVTPPAPPTEHPSKPPPRGYDIYHSDSQSQPSSASDARTAPEPVSPVSPISPRVPSRVTSRSAPSNDTTLPFVRSSVHQEGPVTPVPQPSTSSSSASPGSPQRDVVESPLPPLPPSPLPQSALVVLAPPGSSPYQPSDTALSPIPAPAYMASPKNLRNGAPPPYTPV